MMLDSVSWRYQHYFNSMKRFQLKLTDGFMINSELIESHVSNLSGISQRNMGNGYVWYTLPPSEIATETVTVDICFFQSNLESLKVSIFNPDKYGHGWDDYSEHKQRLRAEDTKLWLKRLGYDVGKHQWGDIWAGYDLKSGSSFAVIRYIE